MYKNNSGLIDKTKVSKYKKGHLPYTQHWD